MRYAILLGAAALMLALFGCSSNPAGSITGPADPAPAGMSLNSAPVPGAPPSSTPSAAPGFYGKVSNLSASGFTLTSPSGSTLNVTFTPETEVLYQGSFSNVADSPLANGMFVTVTGSVSGLPQHATARASFVVINSSLTNRGLVVAD